LLRTNIFVYGHVSRQLKLYNNRCLDVACKQRPFLGNG
jgi:hypothetical protein